MQPFAFLADNWAILLACALGLTAVYSLLPRPRRLPVMAGAGAAVAAPSPWPDREKYPEVFVIDELRCIYCGMCEQACPCDAIELTTLYDLTGLSRTEMMFDKEKLLSVFDQTVAAGTDPVRTHAGKLSVASEPNL